MICVEKGWPHWGVFLGFLAGDAAATGLGRFATLRFLLPDLAKPSGSGGSWPSTNKVRSPIEFPEDGGARGFEILASTAAPKGHPVHCPALFPDTTLRRKWKSLRATFTSTAR